MPLYRIRATQKRIVNEVAIYHVDATSLSLAKLKILKNDAEEHDSWTTETSEPYYTSTDDWEHRTMKNSK